MYDTVRVCVCVFAIAVNISVTKDGIKFSATGDIGTANITCRHNPHAEKVRPWLLSSRAHALVDCS